MICVVNETVNKTYKEHPMTVEEPDLEALNDCVTRQVPFDSELGCQCMGTSGECLQFSRGGNIGACAATSVTTGPAWTGPSDPDSGSRTPFRV